MSNDDKESSENVAAFKDTNSPKRPQRLEAEVVRFQNNHEQWIAVVGMFEGKPYEIFTGRAEDTFLLPKNLDKGWILKHKCENGNNRYDFQYLDKDGFKVTYEGLSRSFDQELNLILC